MSLILPSTQRPPIGTAEGWSLLAEISGTGNDHWTCSAARRLSRESIGAGDLPGHESSGHDQKVGFGDIDNPGGTEDFPITEAPRI